MRPTRHSRQLCVCLRAAGTEFYRKGIFKLPERWEKCVQRNGNYTGLFISPSGISELDCTATKTDTAERSISIGRESLQVFF